MQKKGRKNGKRKFETTNVIVEEKKCKISLNTLSNPYYLELENMKSTIPAKTPPVFILFVALICCQCEGFTFVGTSQKCVRNAQRSFDENSSWNLFSSNNGDNYDKDELLRVAQDPKLFEEYVLQRKNKTKLDEETNSMPGIANDPSRQIDEENNSRKGGYVSIEEWDEKRSSDDLSWEEKVQFDGQRFGNQYNQNEILRKNLKSW